MVGDHCQQHILGGNNSYDNIAQPKVNKRNNSKNNSYNNFAARIQLTNIPIQEIALRIILTIKLHSQKSTQNILIILLHYCQ